MRFTGLETCFSFLEREIEKCSSAFAREREMELQREAIKFKSELSFKTQAALSSIPLLCISCNECISDGDVENIQLIISSLFLHLDTAQVTEQTVE